MKVPGRGITTMSKRAPNHAIVIAAFSDFGLSTDAFKSVFLPSEARGRVE